MNRVVNAKKSNLVNGLLLASGYTKISITPTHGGSSVPYYYNHDEVTNARLHNVIKGMFFTKFQIALQFFDGNWIVYETVGIAKWEEFLIHKFAQKQPFNV